MQPQITVILDNGASSIKAGLARGPEGDDDDQPKLISNAIVRSKGDKTTYFGHQLERCRDYSALHYRLPFEKGYLVDWDAQKAVWDGVFSSEVLNVDTAESSLLITEPYFNLPNIQDVYDQFVFEEYEFYSYHRCTPAATIPFGHLFQAGGPSPPECLVVIDSGFSFTHVVPIINNQIQWYAVKRLDVGGKLLTNQLKELVSYRQWNMMDETYIMNHAKETCCYVSTGFFEDLETCRSNPKKNSIVREYVLPNFSINRPGRIRLPNEELSTTDQVLHMENERFTIPELLFRPDDIGLEQSGLAATVAASIALLPHDLRGMFWANIGLIGGSTNFPGFYERLSSELLSLTPVEYDLQIYRSEDAITEAYRSAIAFVNDPAFSAHVVTREEYLEVGSNASRRKFPGWQSSSAPGDADISKITQESMIEDRGQPSRKPNRSRMRTTTAPGRRR
ncbi:actin-related protein Arp6 [Suillus fuscotomentosus]|uniref:Actin-like protein ARP6 n=1 Tax=Suillus fuscotomentosus TaxID=1912939 RepID=A0AAD4HM00_9AGAM|nr:actin-related protein Arp6 [Suillus fuscotomentosus]KAG1901091.1 actin-related protein Arp6 [Suillus fuscotomentosus]